MWTRNLGNMPNFSHQNLVKHFISAESSIDQQPKNAGRHKKQGYQLFESGFVTGILVKPGIKMNEESHYLIKGKVNAQMKRQVYTSYAHLHTTTGEVRHASCECPAGKGGCCKHIAALLFQILDYKELELTEVPLELSCTEKLMAWNLPSVKIENRGAILFEDLLFEQADYNRDKKGRKRPFVKGKRDEYNAVPFFAEKVSREDIERLKNGLGESPLTEVLDDNNCNPFDYDTYCKNLPSRSKLENKKKALSTLNTENARNTILKQLNKDSDAGIILSAEHNDYLIKEKLMVTIDQSLEIERNTRGQADCPEWYLQRKKRLTASNFGGVMNRRESIFPKSLIEKITTSSNSKVSNSCLWGKDNEENALLEYFGTVNNVQICKYVGFIINPKWPWLGASPDALAHDSEEPSPYGAIEVKCPSSQVNKSVAEACLDKNFYLHAVNGQAQLKRNHPYYYQLQGIMAICQLQWIDFVVYTVADPHIERVRLDSQNWKSTMLPKLTKFYFDFLV